MALRSGELVAIPTETVYGLAAIASRTDAVQKIYSVKKRPTSHPLILHIAKTADLAKWAVNVSKSAKILTTKYWPGPLTVIVERSDLVSDAITGGRSTVAIRCPNHSVALALLTELGDAVVAPSANRFGKVSPTSAEHVVRDLGGDVAIVLDGGECEIGLESTIVDCTVDPPQLLRAGAITAEQIMTDCKIAVTSASGESRAPGMLDKHYAPNCKVIIAKNRDEAESIKNQHEVSGKSVEIIDYGNDLKTYAHNLYARLRQADLRQTDAVIAVMAPEHDLGVAINERLQKAANSSN